jgi:hypothetical protein
MQGLVARAGVEHSQQIGRQTRLERVGSKGPGGNANRTTQGAEREKQAIHAAMMHRRRARRSAQAR